MALAQFHTRIETKLKKRLRLRLLSEDRTLVEWLHKQVMDYLDKPARKRRASK